MNPLLRWFLQPAPKPAQVLPRIGETVSQAEYNQLNADYCEMGRRMGELQAALDETKKNRQELLAGLLACIEDQDAHMRQMTQMTSMKAVRDFHREWQKLAPIVIPDELLIDGKRPRGMGKRFMRVDEAMELGWKQMANPSPEEAAELLAHLQQG